MITIFKNESNDVVVTLSEYATVSDPNYLFIFKNKEKNTESICLCGTDITTDRDRYNEFTITDKSNPDYLLSEVDLSPGQYYYNAYQLTNDQVASLPTLDIDNYIKVEGPCQMMVKKESTPNTFYIGASLENTVYEG